MSLTEKGEERELGASCGNRSSTVTNAISQTEIECSLKQAFNACFLMKDRRHMNLATLSISKTELYHPCLPCLLFPNADQQVTKF